MAPTDRPLPRFIAEPPHEPEPYGRWAETLANHFAAACKRMDPGLLPESEVTWFPERTYAGRVYVPAAARAPGGEEVFGYVSFWAGTDSAEPHDFAARADWTSDTAEQNPRWKLDLSDEVIARWRGPRGMRGDLTLVWGRPLVHGGAVASAELGHEVVDQCDVGESERFTLVALDAVAGLGDELYLEVKLWSSRGELLATETLYDDAQ